MTMPTTIPDLWSPDIRVDVLTPVAILNCQVSYFDKKTQGILQAGIFTTDTGDRLIHQLDLVAPVLGNYRRTLLTAEHGRFDAYPAIVTSQAFLPEQKRVGELDIPTIEAGAAFFKGARNQREARTQEEFMDLVRQVLHSGLVRSLIQSLIARSNETRGMLGLSRPNGSDAGGGGVPEAAKETKES
jgi:hypothetical protein